MARKRKGAPIVPRTKKVSRNTKHGRKGDGS